MNPRAGYFFHFCYFTIQVFSTMELGCQISGACSLLFGFCVALDFAFVIALGLFIGLLLVPCYINQKSLLICAAYTLSNWSYDKFRTVTNSAYIP